MRGWARMRAGTWVKRGSGSVGATAELSKAGQIADLNVSREKWQSAVVLTTQREQATLPHEGKVYSLQAVSLNTPPERRLKPAAGAVLRGSLLALLTSYNLPLLRTKDGITEKVNNNCLPHFQCSHYISPRLCPMFPVLLRSKGANIINVSQNIQWIWQREMV